MDFGYVLLHAHSGLRFLVILAAAIALAVLAWGWSAQRPFAGQSRASLVVFVATLHLQVVIGFAMLFVRPLYPAIMWHMLLLLAAAGVAQAASIFARKQPEVKRAHGVALAGVGLALLLIFAGIMTIRPHPFHMTPGAGADATSTG
jgi:hypothetical protein